MTIHFAPSLGRNVDIRLQVLRQRSVGYETANTQATLTAESVCSPNWMSWLLEQFPHICRAAIIESRYRIGGGIELDVDVAHAVLGRPGDAVLELGSPSNVDSDAILQCH